MVREGVRGVAREVADVERVVTFLAAHSECAKEEEEEEEEKEE